MAEEQTQPILDELMRRIQSLEDLIRNHGHKGYDLTQKLFNTFLNSVSFLNSIQLGDGTEHSGTLTIKVADTKGDSYILAGSITASDWANSGGNSGFILGIDDSAANNPVKFYMGKPSNYIKYDGTTLTVVGSLTVSSLDIPDTVTADSFHVDTSGNMWLGATTFAAAPGKISKAGAGTFSNITITGGSLNINSGIFQVSTAGALTGKNVSIGGTTQQYTVNDNGIFTFGDGSDGSVTISGATTLTTDKYYTDLTVNSGVTLNTGGYRIFCTGTLTVNGTISGNGNNGTAGTNATTDQGGAGGAGGTALADGYLKGSLAGAQGGRGGDRVTNGGIAAGTNGTTTSNSLGSSGRDGGAGGNGVVLAGAAKGTGGTVTAANLSLRAGWHLQTLLDVGSTGATIKYDNSASSAGGGGGGGGDAGAFGGGGGGGAGSGGRIIAIYARNIVVAAAGVIRSNGGNGGNGGNSGSNGGGGGGGGGGNGGPVVLVYNTLTNNGTIQSTGGTKGTGGANGGGGATNGDNGVDGTAGTIFQFLISL